VKVYLVRCDNKEKYKETVRKEIKDWVKSLDVSTSGKSTIKGQERHDAYEYLILHVVLPGTLAATQSRSLTSILFLIGPCISRIACATDKRVILMDTLL